MFVEHVTKEQLEYAKHLVAYYEFGMRGKGDGTKEQQFIGMLGQTVMADLLGKKRPKGGEGFDGGKDFIINSKRVDVKTMNRTVDMQMDYVHNFVGYQRKYNVNYYIFTSFNKTTNELTICGFIDKESFFKKAKYYKKGETRIRDDGTSFKCKAPLYEIKQSDLLPVNNIEQLKQAIK